MGNYKRKTGNPKMGRPKVDIKKDEFEKLCALQCTQEDIADLERLANLTLKQHPINREEIKKDLQERIRRLG